MAVLLKNGTLIDPETSSMLPCDILLEQEKILKIQPDIPTEGHEVLPCDGLMIAPGLVDMHVHFRDPGLTYKEDIFTGSAAAAAGGVTTAACMPNTKPVLDTPEQMEYVLSRSQTSGCHVLPIGAVTVGQRARS